jgi:ribosomal-protein-alanine N-acetyltransferase
MTAIASERLDLPPVTVEALEALISGDRERLQASAGATFPTPLTAPPLTEDALPHFRDVLRQDPHAAAWWSRWLIESASGTVVGVAGFAGAPDAEGTVTLGYSVYPAMQRQGFAAEAAIALTEWALAQPGVRRVRATIPPGHVASQRVAAHAGLRRTDLIETDEGPVEVWERLRD